MVETPAYVVKSGIQPLDPDQTKQQAVIAKVIGKIVRVTVTDNRVFVGKLLSVDQTKALFVENSLELLDKTQPDYFSHELFTPVLLNQTTAHLPLQLKQVGNIVVPGHHVKRIQLDKRLQAEYDTRAREELARGASKEAGSHSIEESKA